MVERTGSCFAIWFGQIPSPLQFHRIRSITTWPRSTVFQSAAAARDRNGDRPTSERKEEEPEEEEEEEEEDVE